jgi:hypothetical protein
MSLVSCISSNNDCAITPNEILNKYRGKVYVVYRKQGVIKATSDSGINRIKRGVYYFLDEGEFESYKFFQDTSAYSYNEVFGRSGGLIKHEGDALVDRIIKHLEE